MSVVALHPIQATLIQEAAKAPRGWSHVKGAIEGFAWELCQIKKLGEFKDHIPGQEIKFRLNDAGLKLAGVTIH